MYSSFDQMSRHIHTPDEVKQSLTKPIQLADRLTNLADDAHSFKEECLDLKSKAQHLSRLLHQAAQADLAEPPTLRIMYNTFLVLDEADKLVTKCSDHGLPMRAIDVTEHFLGDSLSFLSKSNSNGVLKRVTQNFLNFVSSLRNHFPYAFKKISSWLGDSIANVSWLLRFSADEPCLGLPPIAACEPCLAVIWELMATLRTGSLDQRSDAVASVVSIARDSESQGKLIVKEGGLRMLLELVEEGEKEAARAIGLLGRKTKSVREMVGSGVDTVFAKVLKVGPAKVQAMVAWAIAEMAAGSWECQNLFVSSNVVSLLIADLAGLELEEDSARMKAMVVKALWQLAKGNSTTCSIITESEAFLGFAEFLEKGTGELQLNSAMAVMEIACVAEQNADLLHSAFKPNSPSAKAVIDQLYRVVKESDDSDDLLVPCVIALGCLSKAFRSTGVIEPLVELLEGRRERVVSKEAAIALSKFACTDNSLHVDHSKAIIGAGGAKHLVQLVYFREDHEEVQIASLILLCYIALHVPCSEELSKAEIGKVLDWASKQNHLVQDPLVGSLLPEAKKSMLDGALPIPTLSMGLTPSYVNGFC